MNIVFDLLQTIWRRRFHIQSPRLFTEKQHGDLIHYHSNKSKYRKRTCHSCKIKFDNGNLQSNAVVVELDLAIIIIE